MAKKRREKPAEEEVDFKLPKFDEEKFLKKERRNVKTLFLSFVFGIIIALISFGFWVLLSDSDFRWELVFLFGIFNASWLRYLFLRLDIDLTDFGKRGWFGAYAIYFFTWLVVLIVLVNPPFYDDEPPNITVVILPEMQELGGTVNIVSRIIDNVDVKKQDISFSLTYPNGTTVSPDFSYENNFFIYTYENSENIMGTYNFTLSAADVNGHKTAAISRAFIYDNDTIKLPEPPGAEIPPGPKVTYLTTIKFDVGAEVSRVYYTVDGGDEINATKTNGVYETSPQQEGWIKNANVTIRACAEVIYYFKNSAVQFNNTIVDTDQYYFNVSGDPEVGTEASPTIKLPRPGFEQVPGFGTIVVLVALVAAVLIFKYRRKDRRT